MLGLLVSTKAPFEPLQPSPPLVLPDLLRRALKALLPK
jgi:hypothetical protein